MLDETPGNNNLLMMTSLCTGVSYSNLTINSGNVETNGATSVSNLLRMTSFSSGII